MEWRRPKPKERWVSQLIFNKIQIIIKFTSFGNDQISSLTNIWAFATNFLIQINAFVHISIRWSRYINNLLNHLIEFTRIAGSLNQESFKLNFALFPSHATFYHSSSLILMENQKNSTVSSQSKVCWKYFSRRKKKKNKCESKNDFSKGNRK